MSSLDRAIAIDYNGDGKDDIMCYRPGSGIVFLLQSNGDGSFSKVYSSPKAGDGIANYDFMSGYDKAISFDYNGDGYEDLLTYRPGSKIVWISKSNGNGTFTTSYSSNFNGIGGFDFGHKNDLVISLDYNGDGLDDLLCYRPGHGRARLLKSNGNGSFAIGQDFFNGIAGFNLLSSHDKIISIDLNNDNMSDLIIYRPGSGIVFSILSKGDGEFVRMY